MFIVLTMALFVFEERNQLDFLSFCTQQLVLRLGLKDKIECQLEKISKMLFVKGSNVFFMI